MMNEEEWLLNIAKWRRKKSHEAARLGQVTEQLVKDLISPKQNRFGSVADCWEQLLPEELCRHCRINNIAGGQLEVFVDSPAYLYELRLCSQQLIKQLQQKCPRARIKKIRLTVG
jgi:hypothetical protein